MFIDILESVRKMLRLLSIFCFLLVSINAQQDCNADFLIYHACIAQFRQNQLSFRHDPNKINNDISQCFITSDCQQPALSQAANGRNEKMTLCYKQAQDFARRPIENCMVDVKQFIGFTLPKDNAWQSELVEDPRTVSYSDFEARKQISTLCLSPESRSQVRSCLNSLRKNSNSFTVLKQKCDADKECYKKISNQCQKKFDEAKDTVCECASQTLGNLKNDFDKNFRSCYGSTTPDDNKLVGYLIKEICHLDEICVERVDTVNGSHQ